jgi:hypothetical protein
MINRWYHVITITDHRPITIKKEKRETAIPDSG